MLARPTRGTNLASNLASSPSLRLPTRWQAAKSQARIDAKLDEIERSKAIDEESLLRSLDQRLAEIESQRSFEECWMHVDLDAFYAAVEMRDDPSLRNVPFAVGGVGMISTANYEARKFGVRSAMPGFIALKLCPHLRFVKPDFSKYTAAAEQVRAVLRIYDPKMRTLGLDEATLRLTTYCQEHGVSPQHIAAELRTKVKQATGGLTCSCGIAPARWLAKVCSDINKPDGCYLLAAKREAVLEFTAKLSVRKVGGVGKVTERILEAIGIKYCGDIVPNRGLLHKAFGQRSCEWFMRVALGVDNNEIENEAEERQRKSISCERTFSTIDTLPELKAMVISLA